MSLEAENWLIYGQILCDVFLVSRSDGPFLEAKDGRCQ